jgi:hypothetical protein
MIAAAVIYIAPVPPHVRSAWRSWLAALATDAEAAIAAALTYESLSGDGREAWLEAIGTESSTLDVPAVAFYGPLLGVESDPVRIEKMHAAVATNAASAHVLESEPRASLGVAKGGMHACVIAAPVYLHYVRVLVCRYTPRGGFVSAAHDPLRHVGDLASFRDVEGIAVESTPLPVVVDELSHAVLADRRQNRPTLPALEPFVDLFAPDPRWMSQLPGLARDRRVGY